MTFIRREIFYTKEHEWIHFSDRYAYVGISKFKLTGIRKIENIGLFEVKIGDTLSQGRHLLNFYYKEYVIAVHSPITCRLLGTNPIITNGGWEDFITHPEEKGWLFKVEPLELDKSHLTNNETYRECFASDINI